MRSIKIILIALLTTFLSSCSTVTSFFIINNTSGDIKIMYKLLPSSKNDFTFAIKDTVRFYNLKKDTEGNIDPDDTKNSPTKGNYIKSEIDNDQVYTLTLSPKTAITFGHDALYNFNYRNIEERHKIFKNVIEITIYRMDTKDTLVLKQSMLADLINPFDKTDIALLFD